MDIESEEYLPGQTPGNDETAHMDAFRAPEIGGEDGLEHDVIGADETGADDALEGEALEAPPMSKEAFWTVFQAGFSLPGGFVPDLAPLAITDQEKPMARQSADAIHDLLSIYYPAALRPMGGTFALVLTAAPFLIMKVQVVRAVMADRKAARIAAARAQEAAFYGRVEKPAPANEKSAPAPEFKSQRSGPSPLSWMDAEQAA